MAGNATVSLYNGNKMVSYDLWLQIISTATQNEFQTQQVRGGISWIPIRRAEMFVNFVAIWPVAIPKPKPGTPHDAGYEDIDPTDGFAKMNKFQNAIRKHQLAVSNGSTDIAMTLTYNNNSDPVNYNTLVSTKPLDPLVYNGFIQTVEMEYARFKNVYLKTYNMNIINRNTANPSLNYRQSSTNTRLNITYAPTAYDINAYGPSWYNTQEILSESYQQIKGMP